MVKRTEHEVTRFKDSGDGNTPGTGAKPGSENIKKGGWKEVQNLNQACFLHHILIDPQAHEIVKSKDLRGPLHFGDEEIESAHENAQGQRGDMKATQQFREKAGVTMQV